MHNKAWALTIISLAMMATVQITSYADMDLETDAAVSGIAVALNNYYARTMDPEKALTESVKAVATDTIVVDTTQPQSATTKLIEAVEETKPAVAESTYQDVAIAKVTDSVNIRTDANTTSDVVGKIYNNAAAKILDTVDGENGKWYKIQSGNVTGYIKAEYFTTGQEAESIAKEVGTTYGTVQNTASLRLRENPDMDSSTLTLLAEGATYLVTGQEGDYLKIQVDDDLTGYVFKDYVKTDVKFDSAISNEDEAAKKAEEDKLKKEADEALAKLEEAKKESEASKKTTAAEATKKETTTVETTKEKTTAADTTAPDSVTVAVNNSTTAAETTIGEAPTTEKETTVKETTTVAETTKKETTKAQEGPGGPGSSSGSEVTSATRNAIVAYAKQFLGNPYVYGGTSLTNGADCSGFTMQVYANFGYSIGRSSRDQAANGTSISSDSAKPGDLFFYASGDYINHVAMYIGGGQVIHASNSTTGIIISNAYYRTPCKVVSFLD